MDPLDLLEAWLRDRHRGVFVEVVDDDRELQIIVWSSSRYGWPWQVVNDVRDMFSGAGDARVYVPRVPRPPFFAVIVPKEVDGYDM